MEYDEILEKLKDETLYAEENFIPIIREKSARFLFDFVKKNRFKKVLEIGTAIGFSGSIILSAGVEMLTTMDINEKSLAVAGKTFEKMGYYEVIYFARDKEGNTSMLIYGINVGGIR
jgi:predicted O-methyltransferase YrrM